jgi:hypothetical protein
VYVATHPLIPSRILDRCNLPPNVSIYRACNGQGPERFRLCTLELLCGGSAEPSINLVRFGSGTARGRTPAYGIPAAERSDPLLGLDLHPFHYYSCTLQNGKCKPNVLSNTFVTNREVRRHGSALYAPPAFPDHPDYVSDTQSLPKRPSQCSAEKHFRCIFKY